MVVRTVGFGTGNGGVGSEVLVGFNNAAQFGFGGAVTIINIGTATLGATIGAGGLGAPIIAGLVSQNPAYVIEGALFVALFAIIIDLLFDKLERRFQPA